MACLKLVSFHSSAQFAAVAVPWIAIYNFLDGKNDQEIKRVAAARHRENMHQMEYGNYLLYTAISLSEKLIPRPAVERTAPLLEFKPWLRERLMEEKQEKEKQESLELSKKAELKVVEGSESWVMKWKNYGSRSDY